MPGLSQLKQFNKDILSLGDEVNVRSQRGEKPVRIAIPGNIQDIDDSEDFVMGMPSIEANVQDNSLTDAPIDFSEITGEKTDETAGEKSSDSIETPDLSDLLAPMTSADGDSGEPDLSEFLGQEEEIVEEEEPEPPSIADMDLNDLLGGIGFDGSTSEEFGEDKSQAEDDDEDYYSGGFGDENYVPKKKEAPLPDFMQDSSQNSDDAILAELGLDNLGATTENEAPAELGDLGIGDLDIPEDTPPADDLGLGDLGDLGDLGVEVAEDAAPATAPAAQTDDLGLGDLGDLGEFVTFEDSTPASDSAPADDLGLGDLGDLGDLGVEVAEDAAPAAAPAPQADDLGLGDLGDLGEFVTFEDSTPASDSAPADDLGLGDLGDLGDLGVEVAEDAAPATAPAAQTDDLGLGDLGDLGEFVTFEDSTPSSDSPPADDLGLGDLGDLGDLGVEVAEDAAPAAAPAPQADDLGLGDLGDLGEFVTFEDSTPASDSAPADDLGLGDLGDLGSIEDVDLDSIGNADTADLPELNDGFGSDFGAAADIDELDFNTDDTNGDTSISLDSFDFDSHSEMPNIKDEIPDFGMEDIETAEQIETFDTSGMDNIEFNIPDTDAQLNNNSSGADFELGSEHDFILEGHDFEIPGFSDVETAKEESRNSSILVSKNKAKNAEEELPPNTLSDSQYKQFIKNLNEYPLNVRLAFEDLLVKNEFTDDAEFEVVEKILNKSSARSVASTLEKMLDVSIPVPRDYEHRTAEEYEAYKKSLQYQLKNKIIPAIFICVIMLVVGFGLFQFGKNCIYIPAKANQLYKQGYAMLEADEYPQSQIRFTEATKYRLNKKWFFKYARGYRNHKQYLRAEWMYQNILNYFKHDKSAGLEYAAMELNDLANYEKAEEICRREILDYHINDADGILLLGDIFLEWGTEKDPEMLEKAREQYATLIQLYKPNLLYQSRMMRYFIRTDNFRNVLQLKELFLPKEKNLSAEDWAELAGYMMDKLYGPLAPSDEYLRAEIEDVRLMLMRAVKLNPKNPIASYNLSRYFIETNETNAAKETLSLTIDNFKNASELHKRDIYKYIDSYRLLGEQYSDVQEYLRAQEYYTEGISLYLAEHDASGFDGNKKIGVLFEDQANIDYFISGDFDNALQNYISSVELENDNSSIRYKIGYIQYKKKNYNEALGSFMKAGDGNIKETNLMLAMANTLSLRGDNYAAQGYYEDLIINLDREIAEKGIVLPQSSQDDYDLVETYLHAANNYGVTLYRLASRTGNSSLNAEAIVQLSQSVRAWDALTRNQDTLVRLGGSNLAEENIKYITHPIPDFEPAIYTEIPRILVNTERF